MGGGYGGCAGNKVACGGGVLGFEGTLILGLIPVDATPDWPCLSVAIIASPPIVVLSATASRNCAVPPTVVSWPYVGKENTKLKIEDVLFGSKLAKTISAPDCIDFSRFSWMAILDQFVFRLLVWLG